MDIGFFFMHAPGESMGSIYRVWNLCNGLTKLSHKCFIFTPFKYVDSENWGPLVNFITVPVISSRRDISKRLYRIVRKILDIQILSNFTLLNPKFFNLVMDRISQELLKTIKESSINLDVIIGETEIGGLILTKIKDDLKIPIITDYQNFWPEELVEHKVIKRYGRRFKYLVDLERKVINESDLIITISDYLRDFLIKFLGSNPNNKIKALNNGGITFLEKPKKKPYPPKIINAGMVVYRSNLKLFLESMTYVVKMYPETKIYITRKGEKLKQIMNLAKKLDLIVDFYWKENNKEFLELLSECHVGVVTSNNDLSRKLGFVAKIYDYFSAGIPVVGNDIGGFTSIISIERVGLLSTNNPKDLADKIIKFLDNPDMAYECGQRSIKLLQKKLSVEESARKLIKYINTIKLDKN